MKSSDLSLDVFKELFLNALKNFVSVSIRYLRANLSTFVNKGLSKALMGRKKLYKEKTTQARLDQNKKRHTFVSILCKSEKAYFENLDIKNLSGIRKIKCPNKSKLKLSVIRNEYKIANIFDNFLINVALNSQN